MALDDIFSQMDVARAKTASLVVRHIGAFVLLRNAVSPERLAGLEPIATTHDKTTIEAFFDAVRAAEPTPAAQASEQRWSVTCNDAQGTPLLAITSSIFTPRDGTIAEGRVLFGNDRLVEFLAQRYAPQEAGATATA